MPRHPRLTSWLIVFAALFQAGCASSISGTSAVVPDAQRADVITVYGGLGFLDARGQPALAEMLGPGGGSGDDIPLVGRMVRDNARGTRLTALSDYPLVMSDEAFAEALASKLQIQPAEVTGLALQDEVAGSSIAVLSLIGGLEQDYDLIQNAGGQQIVQRVALVTVTAVLSRPASGEILLTRDATTLVNDRGGERASERLNRLAEAYADAADRALTAISAVTRRNRGTDGRKTMVTGVAVAAPQVQRIFDMKSTNWRASNDICALPPQCTTDGSGACQGMMAAMAQLTTEALGERGEVMLPPWNWAAWGVVSQNELGHNIGTLRINTSGGFIWLDDRLKLVLDPDAAPRKIVAVLDRFETNLQSGSNQYVRTRLFTADLALETYESTPGAACSQAQPAGSYSRIPGTGRLAINESRDLPETLENELLQSYAIITLRQALGSGATS